MLKRTLFVAILVALTVAGTALAAPPTKSSTSSIRLVLMNGAAATATTSGATYAGTVTFDVATTATTQPFVHLKCSQNGALVLESWQGFFATALGSQQFNLGPTPAWTGGSATCTAYLENWDSYSSKGKTSTLASTTFGVSG